MIAVEKSLKDERFEFELNDILKIRRTVEMHQWRETEHKDDDGNIRFTYDKTWSSYHEST